MRGAERVDRDESGCMLRLVKSVGGGGGVRGCLQSVFLGLSPPLSPPPLPLADDTLPGGVGVSWRVFLVLIVGDADLMLLLIILSVCFTTGLKDESHYFLPET